MITRIDMLPTAAMLVARIGLYDRIRRVEYELAHAEQSQAAAALMRGRSHALGNAIQILKLSVEEIERRNVTGIDDLLPDMQSSAEQAIELLGEMFAAARSADRKLPGPVVSHAVRGTVELARSALPGVIDLRIEIDDTVRTVCTGEELEAIVIAAILDAAAAPRVSLVLRERVVQGKRWVELLRTDDRGDLAEGELAHMFEAHSLLHVVVAAAKQAGGEASISPTRSGMELAVELPAIPSVAG